MENTPGASLTPDDSELIGFLRMWGNSEKDQERSTNINPPARAGTKLSFWKVVARSVVAGPLFHFEDETEN